jgi:geranylgeranyl pyrophosphate synthase
MTIAVTAARIRETVLSLPEMAAWPEVVNLFPETSDKPIRMDWQLPALACQAVGGDSTVALPAVAAIACLQISIILADDILDEDPRGEYHRLGYGRTCNLALAFQSAALALINRAPAPLESRAAAATCLAQAALATCYGQDLDVQNLRGEANYWRVVSAKSTPFYGAALQVGAFLGGAAPAVAQGLYDLGVRIGEITQIFDDLMDAFQTPANPDWLEGRNNLALLYATTAQHPQRQRLLELMPESADPARLAEGQRILISSGAVSYCVYQLFQRYQAGRAALDTLSLADAAGMQELLQLQVEPVVHWLPTIGAATPEEVARLVA